MSQRKETPGKEKRAQERLILGIDPGVALTGYAIVRVRGSRLRLLACDVIRTKAGTPLPHRLQLIYQALDSILQRYAIVEAAVELLFFGSNTTTAMQVGCARGVILLALANHRIPIAEYTPTQVKFLVVGSGTASKRDVGEAVQRILHLNEIPRPDDAADAAAIAVCHLLSGTIVASPQC